MAGGQERRFDTMPAQKGQERPCAFRGEWYYCFIDKRSIHRGTGGDVMSKVDIGRARSLSIKCLAEVSWHDDDRMRQDVREAGGLAVDQFDVKWTPENAAGISALVESVDGGGGPGRGLMGGGGGRED